MAALLLPWLALLPGAHGLARSLLGGVATLAVFWALWRSVDVWAQFLASRPWAADNSSARSLLSVVRNLSKVFVAVGGVVATLAALGYPVATLLAGLGIGGIALAFGAQKTIENLFGSVALAADQPFRVGQVRRVITDIEAMLRANPRVWPDVVVARLAALGASSLDVEVLCWFRTSDFALFRDLRQEALLGIMRIVAEAGTSFAFPTQTLHVVDAKDPSRAPRSG